MTDAARRERAEHAIRDVSKALPDVWLGGRQRYVLVEVIVTALADAELRVWEEVMEKAQQASNDSASPEWILE